MRTSGWTLAVSSSSIFWGTELLYHGDHLKELVPTFAWYLLVLGIGCALFSLFDIFFGDSWVEWIARKLDRNTEAGYTGEVRGGRHGDSSSKSKVKP